jgi:UDP-2,3-diacylglucosamine pyrophosphatase LpxH
MAAEVPELSRVAVVSDLHLPPAERLGNFSAGGDLAAWTAGLARSGASNAALVLAGDILDLLLVEDRPATLNLATAARTIGETLRRLEREQAWAAAWRDALRSWGERGGRTILVPGNHDPEWFHPDTTAELARWITGGAAAAPGLMVWREPEPWKCRAGPWHVLIAHGHRGDAVNDIDPDDVHRALHDGSALLPLPPGSQLVLGPLQRFKRAMHSDGRRRFPFLDAVKPEVPAVLLLLLYLDPGLLIRTLPAALQPLAGMVMRHVRRALCGGSVLGAELAADSGETGTPGGTAVETLARALAADLVGALSEADRQAPDATLVRLEAHLQGASAVPEPGTLAADGGLRRALLRAWLRRESQTSRRFFDPHRPGPADGQVIAHYLPEGCRRRVVIVGHTHAAREIQLDSQRVYLNTGTWTDLLDLSAYDDQDASLTNLIDMLAGGTLPSFRRQTWAEVTTAGPVLRTYPDPR